MWRQRVQYDPKLLSCAVIALQGALGFQCRVTGGSDVGLGHPLPAFLEQSQHQWIDVGGSHLNLICAIEMDVDVLGFC